MRESERERERNAAAFVDAITKITLLICYLYMSKSPSCRGKFGGKVEGGYCSPSAVTVFRLFGGVADAEPGPLRVSCFFDSRFSFFLFFFFPFFLSFLSSPLLLTGDRRVPVALPTGGGVRFLQWRKGLQRFTPPHPRRLEWPEQRIGSRSVEVASSLHPRTRSIPRDGAVYRGHATKEHN